MSAVVFCSGCGASHDRPGQRYCRSCHATYMRDWRRTHPLTPAQRFKDNARSHANFAKRRGRLVEEPCAHCLSVGTEMHHADYSRPLDVVWLCRPCHLAFHRGMRAIRRRFELRLVPPVNRETLTMSDLVRRHCSPASAPRQSSDKGRAA